MWFGGKRKKNRFSYKPAKSKVRYIVLGLFALSIILGTAATVYIAPYSAYGRMATYLFAPIYDAINNLQAYFAQENGSYMFYEKEIVFKGGFAFAVALVSFIAVAAIAFFKGRAYCNTICPVGTILSFIARFSLFRPVIDKSKCIKCRRCERNCKSSCIDAANGTIDYSRCVTCLNCTGICSKKAISYKFRLGGDEFAVILTNGDYQIRDELIQKLKTSMKELESKEQPWEQVSIACGLSIFDSTTDTCVGDVFKRADDAMYSDKKEMKVSRI